MSDMFDAKKRSEIMGKVHSSDTTPEIRVRKLLHSLGYRFRLQRRDLPGNPDIVLPKYKTAIFVHGCFWHGCSNCSHGKRRPASNTEYWNKKLDRNIQRDRENIRRLSDLGWKVLVIWECEIKKKNINALIDNFLKYLS